jgi:hypothetical protein
LFAGRGVFCRLLRAAERKIKNVLVRGAAVLTTSSKKSAFDSVAREGCAMRWFRNTSAVAKLRHIGARESGESPGYPVA